MSTPELTPWFPGDVKPYRPGVYQRETSIGTLYAKWTGRRWNMGQLSVFDATTEICATKLPGLRWRGLAQEPKQ